MIEILRDPVWQFVGAALTLVGIFIAVILSYAQRKRKELSFDILASAPMLDVAARVQDRVRITYLGRPVSKIHFVSVILINTGNVPIIASDFEESVKFNFGIDAEVLDTDLAVKNPRTLKTDIHLESTGFSLDPTLFNPDDSVTVNVLLGQFDGKINVEGRIVGVKEIKERTEFSEARLNNATTRALLLAAFGWGILVGSIPNLVKNEDVTYFTFGAILSSIGIVMFWLAMQRRRRNLLEGIRANRWDDLIIKNRR